MKTILVVGASGYIGSNLVNFLQKKHKVIAAFNKNILKFPGITHCVYKLSERDYMKRLMMLLRPDVIIYCAGNMDFLDCTVRAKSSESVNSLGAVAFSSAADTVPHRLIYLSTAYVYNGKEGNYVESDVMMPETVLGKTKMAGENYVRSKSLEYTIFRFSPIFGVGSMYHMSEFDKIRIKLQRGERVELPNREIHSFLSLDVVLKVIEWAATQETENNTYNLGGLTKISWYDFGLLIADIFGFDRSLIVQSKGQFDTLVDFSLNGSDLVKKLQIDPLVIEQGLDLLKQQLIR